MKRPLAAILAWGLWLWIALVIIGAFAEGTQAGGFVGQSSRILYFHVPMAWTSFVAFLTAGAWSVAFLLHRQPHQDRAATAAVELGLLFGILATASGAMWAKIEWGAYWNWDPRQTSIVFALLFYAAYLALRSAVADPETRRRLAAAYAALGLVIAPFLFFVAPRMVDFSLHPEPVINTEGEVKMGSAILGLLVASSAGFTALFFWVHGLQRRMLALAERR